MQFEHQVCVRARLSRVTAWSSSRVLQMHPSGGARKRSARCTARGPQPTPRAVAVVVVVVMMVAVVVAGCPWLALSGQGGWASHPSHCVPQV